MADENELALYGTVGESFWGEQSFTPSTVRDALAASTGDITVRINSGGGIATEGQAIYNLLKQHAGQVHVVIDGIAASAASLIAMAGDTITMLDGALMMIHDPAQPWIDGRGTEDDHLRAARTLRVMSNAYAAVYAKRSGLSLSEARQIMRDETYLEGRDAVAMGFATATSEESAQAVAAFDYAAYAHAPKHLLEAGAGLARRNSSRRAVAALMAGIAAPTSQKGIDMADETTTEDEDLITSETTEETVAEDDDQTTTEEGEELAAEDEETPEARAIAVLNLAALAELSTTEAAALVRSRKPVAQIMQELAAIKSKGLPMTFKPGVPRARILRDEVETRRTGIEGAIVARMAGDRSVAGPARDFMGLTLAEMAHASLGHTGRPGRGAGELRAIEMALTHSTSDFANVMSNALNKRLLAAYQAYQPVYRALAERIDFIDFRPMPISQIGNWPSLLPVGENGEIQYGTVGDKSEVVALIAYARAFSISRQAVVNDDLGAIERMLRSRGQAVAAFEDAVFFNMFLSGSNSNGPTLTETGRQVFNTTDGTLAGTPTAILPASIGLGEAAMMKRKSVAKAGKDADAMFIAATPRILLTGPDKKFEAAQVMAPIQAAQAGNVNPYAGQLQTVAAPHIAGNAWYLFADPTVAPSFMYGYLSGEAGPRMRMDEPFGQQGVSYSVELDFGCGAVDYRGVYKNAGA